MNSSNLTIVLRLDRGEYHSEYLYPLLPGESLVNEFIPGNWLVPRYLYRFNFE